MCLHSNECFSVNIRRNNDVICELTIGLGDNTSLIDDSASDLYVPGNIITVGGS